MYSCCLWSPILIKNCNFMEIDIPGHCFKYFMHEFEITNSIMSCLFVFNIFIKIEGKK